MGCNLFRLIHHIFPSFKIFRCYNLNLIKNCSYYEHNVAHSKDWWVFKNLKDFVVINFGEYIKSTREKLYSKLSEELNLWNVIELSYIFVTTPGEWYGELTQSGSSDNYVYHYNITILNLFDPELQMINTKLVMKTKMKELLSELQKFKVIIIIIIINIILRL